jgi:MFS family permease
MAGFDGLRNGGASRALRIRNYRVYFSGLMVSVSGTWMQTTAQAWLVLQLTHSPLALATVASLQFLPIMLFSLVGGALADRFPRRKVLFFTQAMAASQAILLGTLVLTNTVTIWHIYGLAITLGLINALDMPLRQSFVSELVPLDVLPSAVALNSMAQNLGRILGPALGGVVLAAFGVSTAFYLNALTFSGTLIALLLIDRSQMFMPKAKAKAGVFRDIGQGISYVRKQPSVLFLLIATAFTGMFGQNFTTVIPLVSEYLVKADAAQFGLLNSCLGSGSLLSAIVLTSRGAPSVMRILIAGSAFGLALVAVSFSTNLWLSCVLFAIVGCAYVTYTASVQTSMQMQAPPEMRGRFASMISLLSGGSSPIGQLLTGAIAGGVAVWVAIFFNGLMCCVGMALAYTYLLRNRRAGVVFNLGMKLPDPSSVPAGALALEVEAAVK